LINSEFSRLKRRQARHLLDGGAARAFFAGVGENVSTRGNKAAGKSRKNRGRPVVSS